MNGTGLPRLPANPYYFINNGTTATCQFQVFNNLHTKCVKVEFIQSGEDITAQILYAKNIEGNQLGIDFDSNGSNYPIVTSDDAPEIGYGVEQVSLLLTERHYEPFLTDQSTVIFPNTALTECAELSASMGGNMIDGSPFPATVVFFSNNGASASAQVQSFNGNFMKCVKIELTQSGSDVAARVLEAWHIPMAHYYMIGIDFESVDTISHALATGFTTGAYGVCQLRLETADAGTLRLTATNSYSGATDINGGTLAISGGGQLGGDSYTNTIVNNSQLRFESSADQILSNDISGVGTLLKSSSAKSIAPLTSTLTVSNTDFINILNNAILADCVEISGVLGGSSINPEVPATVFYFENNGTNATCQFQILDGGHTKCSKVEFRQNGAHISAKRVYTRVLISEHNLGFDFDTGGTDGYNYQVVETSMFFNRHSHLTLSGTNSVSIYSGGSVVEKGRLAVNGNPSSLPESGGIIVRKDAELLLNVPGDLGPSGTVGGNNPIYVQGGRLTINGRFNAGNARKIAIDGGILEGTCYDNNGIDNYNYINNLALLNGAVVTGYKMRVGFVSVPAFYVMGTNSASITAGIRLTRHNPAPDQPFTINVANATDDAEPDLYISGDITDFGGTLSGMPILKTGAGSISFSGNNSYTGLTTVAAGTLVLASDTALKSDNRMLLDGGALEMQGFANQIGTLSVGANGGEIRLGDGALYFADSSTSEWNGTLTLTGTLQENTLRFGNDSTALTKAQLDAISYDSDLSIRINNSGYLTATPSATLIIIR
jgi:autotransporter-associated beta strand protein